MRKGYVSINLIKEGERSFPSALNSDNMSGEWCVGHPLEPAGTPEFPHSLTDEFTVQ